MAETNLQKFVKHYKAKGFFYAIYRGIKYVRWCIMCARRGINWRSFAREKKW